VPKLLCFQTSLNLLHCQVHQASFFKRRKRNENCLPSPESKRTYAEDQKACVIL
jgi:hypothetical protein